VWEEGRTPRTVRVKSGGHAVHDRFCANLDRITYTFNERRLGNVRISVF
jgi:hypothetical protein